MTDQKGKKLYKIGYITKLLNLTPRTVRYYDQFGLLPHVKRTEGKVRLFDSEDIEIMKRVRKLQNKEFMPLELIREKLFGDAGDILKTSAIVVDGWSGLSAAALDKVPVTVLPVKLSADRASSVKQLWDSVAKSGKKAVVEPVSQEAFVQAYDKLIKSGRTHIFSIHSSKQFSKTYQNAVAAAKKMPIKYKVTVVDSSSIGTGAAVFAKALAGAIKAGYSSQEISLFVNKNKSLIADMVISSPLSYFTALSATEAQAKPVLNQAGILRPVMVLRDGKAEFETTFGALNIEEAVLHLVSVFSQEVVSRGSYVRQITISHGHNHADAQKLAKLLKEKFAHSKIEIAEYSPAVSTIVGPEALVLSFV